MLLRGAERTLERDRPTLCLELEPYLSGAEACVGVVDWLRRRRYAHFRVFHSNAADPRQVLAEAMRPLSAEDVLGQIRRNEVGPYGTLLAFPDPPDDAGPTPRGGG